MSKSEVVDEVFEQCANKFNSIKKFHISEIYDIFMQVIKDKLYEKGEVRLHQVGTLKVIHCKEKQCHNPQKKGEKITVPAQKRVRFKESISLKEGINS
ncbi:HU family DNA-binding protein [Candidatus Mesenet endosymbiont of Agriotes lineatus]|uniref:HU family DNA-binding protein n=1 Tax=Candidatus Mesenet endosymbiont of Agriotes lineatus TaxID=3077948 RepID=UPI0030D1B1DF